MRALVDIVSSIDPQLAALIGTALGVVVLLGLRHYYGHIPSFWRVRRAVLPVLAELGRGDHPVDDATDVDLAETIPEKTRLGLRDEGFAGTLDAPPAELRTDLGGRSSARWSGGTARRSRRSSTSARTASACTRSAPLPIDRTVRSTSGRSISDSRRETAVGARRFLRIVS